MEFPFPVDSPPELASRKDTFETVESTTVPQDREAPSHVKSCTISSRPSSPSLFLQHHTRPEREPLPPELRNESQFNERKAKGQRRRSSGPTPTKARKRPKQRNSGCGQCTWPVLIITSVTLLLLAMIADSFSYYQRDPKGCALTYMRPEYILMSNFDHERTRFANKYSLFLYREIGQDRTTEPSGIPVLFIPGNAGSYKQVRSLASNAAEYYYDTLVKNPENEHTKLPLDFFTVSFNEEITALHGISLLEQAEYLNDAIQFILSLYPASSKPHPDHAPSSVILIGHSMGGVVSRTLFTLPNHAPGSINTILTLASPHLAPPAPLDPLIAQTYKRVNDFWRTAFETPKRNPVGADVLRDVSIVSIAGGTMDTMIWSDLANLETLVPPSHGFAVFTTSIPKVWVAMDHQSIVWCNQLVEVISQTLFQIIDARKPSKTKDLAERMKIFRKSFLSGIEEETVLFSEAAFENELQPLMHEEISPESMISPTRKLHLPQPDTPALREYLMPIPQVKHMSVYDNEFDTFSLLTNLPLHSPSSSVEIQVCRNSSVLNTNPSLPAPVRMECRTISEFASLIPASRHERDSAYHPTVFSFLKLSLGEMQNWDYVAVVPPRGRNANLEFPEGSFLVAEFFNEFQNVVEARATMTDLALGNVVVIANNAKSQLPILSNIVFPVVDDSLLAYHLTVESSMCSRHDRALAGPLFPVILRQHTNTLHESKFSVGLPLEMDINFHGRLPASLSPLLVPSSSSSVAWPSFQKQRGLNFQLWQDPHCKSVVRMRLKLDIYGSLGRAVKRFDVAVVVFPYATLMLVMAAQLKAWNTGAPFPTFPHALTTVINGPLLPVLLFLSLVPLLQSTTLDLPPLASTIITGINDQVGQSPIPSLGSSLLLGARDPIFWFLPPLLMLMGIGVLVCCWILLGTLVAAVTVVAELVGRRGPEKIWRFFARPMESQDHRFKRRLITTIVLFAIVCTLIPHQFAFLVAFLVHIISCVKTKMKARSQGASQEMTPVWNHHHYQMSLLLLFFTLLPFNLPMLLVWIRNMSVLWFEPGSSDHNLFAVFPMLVYVEVVSGQMLPRGVGGRRASFVTCILLNTCAVFALLFGMRETHLLYSLSVGLVSWFGFLHMTRTRSANQLSLVVGGWWRYRRKKRS